MKSVKSFHFPGIRTAAYKYTSACFGLEGQANMAVVVSGLQSLFVSIKPQYRPGKEVDFATFRVVFCVCISLCLRACVCFIGA